MNFFSQVGIFSSSIGAILSNPSSLLLLFGSVFMGIMFGATPGLTATLGVALLTTLTYGMTSSLAIIALLDNML